MKKNMGKTDTRMRVIAAFIALLFCISGVVSGVVAGILVILAAVFLITSLLQFCPLYSLFGLSTNHSDKKQVK